MNPPCSPLANPWVALSALLTVCAAAWTWIRGRAEPARPWSAHLAWMVVTVVAAAWWRFTLRDGGPLAIIDNVRDLIDAVGIVTQGVWPADGPEISATRSFHSPVWYYVLALPLWSGRVGAVGALVVTWRALTAGALFALVRRLHGVPTALVAVAALAVHGIVQINQSVFTHSNLVFLTIALAVLALVRLHLDRRSEQVVPLFFWLSLAVQFHVTALLVVPVVLAVAVLHGRDAQWRDVGMAALAGLAPVLMVAPALAVHGEDAPWEQLWGALVRSNGLVPVVLGSLCIARPVTFTRTRAAALLPVGLLLWAWQTFPLSHGERVSFLNLGTIPWGTRVSPGLPDFGAPPLWKSLLSFGNRALGISPVSLALAGALVAVGLLSLGGEVVRRRGAVAPHGRSGEASVTLLWFALSVPLGFLLVARAGGGARYLSVPAMALGIVASRGVIAWWKGVRAWSEAPGGPAPFVPVSLAALLCYASFPSLPLAAVLAPLFALGLAARHRRTAGLAWGLGVAGWALWSHHPEVADGPCGPILAAEAMADGLIALPGMDSAGVLERVHASPDVWDGHASAVAPFLHLARLRGGDAHTQTADARHWRVRSAGDSGGEAGAVRLAGTERVAVPFVPAVRRAEASFARPLHQLDGSTVAAVSLPYRFEDEIRYPSWLQAEHPLSAKQIYPDAQGVTADLRVPRDVPADPRLQGVQILATSGSSEVEPYAITPCAVEATVDGVSAALTPVDPQSWRLSIPAQDGRVELAIVVRDCVLRGLDVFDVP